MFALRWLLLTLPLLVLAVAPSVGQPPGAYRPISPNSKEVMKVAKFAVAERSKTEKMSLVKIVSAQSQVVAGLNYKIVLLVRVDDKVRKAEAEVWAKLDQTMELTDWQWRDTGPASKTKGKKPLPPEN
ncbi:MAG: cystatin domain-containing protein [Gemmataceae bacterium]